MTNRPIKSILGVLACALVLSVAATGYQTGAGESRDKSSDGKDSSYAGKATVSSSKWVADPRRGWVRSDERDEQKRRQAEQERSENSSKEENSNKEKEKEGRIVWDY